jgi:hypothetical protein
MLAHAQSIQNAAAWVAVILASQGIVSLSPVVAEEFRFKSQELATELQVGYAVRTLDVNADGQLDIAIVDSKRVLWLEGPSWKEHVVYQTPEARFDNVCFAPLDVNGDGRVDFALGADWQFGNTDSGGTIGWLEHTPQGPWIYHQIASEPTTHRMNWIDVNADGRPWLVVAPLKGRGTRGPGFDQRGVRLLAFRPKVDVELNKARAWEQQVLTDSLTVMHNFDVTDLDDDGRDDMLAASYEGVSWLEFDKPEVAVRRLGSGQNQPAPKRGASEVRHGMLKDGRSYIATVEPWHGDKIVVYLQPKDADLTERMWPRFVIDDELAWGHAIACANLDDDEDQELIVGVRDDKAGTAHRRGLRIYDPQNVEQGIWYRQLVDAGGVAIEDLTVADLDGDQDQDIVAVGRQTHNVKIYWNQQADAVND